jgi:nitrite reductase/ring-hydroxylating ferredoxin subunit
MADGIRVAPASDFVDGQRVLIRIDDRDVFVFEHEGRFFAFENVCRHMGGPVGEGNLIGKVEAILDQDQRQLYERFSTTEIHLVCPWHGWEYDIETGVCVADRRIKLRRYEAVKRGEDVYVIA